ncbi:MAG: Ig-like domain-containing protein [Chloracidobacterium sp.]|nr:Ig-like domain-containing protein [Chloracidobacterium sp.]MDW8217891.1 hypothetical protein [Acidobacteriota bacterium]
MGDTGPSLLDKKGRLCPCLLCGPPSAAECTPTPVNGLTPTWSSSDPSVLRVTEQGFAEAVGVGTALVAGRVGDVTTTVRLTVERGGTRRRGTAKERRAA